MTTAVKAIDIQTTIRSVLFIVVFDRQRIAFAALTSFSSISITFIGC